MRRPNWSVLRLQVMAMSGDLVRKPGIGSRGARGQAHQRRRQIADGLVRELDRWRDIDRLDVDLQEWHVADPGFVFDLDGVVADANDEVGGTQ